VLVLMAGGGCQKDPLAPSGASSTHVRVLSINLDDYRFMDRDGDFQEDDPKPAEDIERLVSTIAASSSDILLLREVGNAHLADELATALAKNGAIYPHRVVSQDGEDHRNLALFSRFPLGVDASRTNDVYRIGEHTHRMARPISDVEVLLPSRKVLRIIHAHLRGGPVPTVTDTYEMRRNEARILTQHIRRVVRENPEQHLLVAGTLHAEPDTPLLNDLLRGETPLVVDVRPIDTRGDAWTEYQPMGERHLRTDYLMASPALVPFVREYTIPDPHSRSRGSRFRPLLVALDL
jgi:hypothetical protein